MKRLFVLVAALLLLCACGQVSDPPETATVSTASAYIHLSQQLYYNGEPEERQTVLNKPVAQGEEYPLSAHGYSYTLVLTEVSERDVTFEGPTGAIHSTRDGIDMVLSGHDTEPPDGSVCTYILPYDGEYWIATPEGEEQTIWYFTFRLSTEPSDHAGRNH